MTKDSVASGDIVIDNIVSAVKKDTTTPMTQVRWPDISTSVSGVLAEDWSVFKARARKARMKYRDALEAAIVELDEAVTTGEPIDWQPVKIAPSRSVRIHTDARETVNRITEATGYKQNVVFATAMHRWANKPTG